MRPLRPMTVLAALLVCMPLLADDPPPQKKPGYSPSKQTPKESSKPADAQKYQVTNKFVGKITKISVNDMKMTIEVQTTKLTSSGTPKATTIREEITISGDVKVRAMKLPERFDENNKLKPYTAEEKARLKGNDPNLPGFAADLANLAPNQHVEVTMGIRKGGPGSAKNKDADVIPEKAKAILIVCTLEESAPPDKKK